MQCYMSKEISMSEYTGIRAEVNALLHSRRRWLCENRETAEICAQYVRVIGDTAEVNALQHSRHRWLCETEEYRTEYSRHRWLCEHRGRQNRVQ